LQEKREIPLCLLEVHRNELMKADKQEKKGIYSSALGKKLEHGSPIQIIKL
jgi:hypothetical protein